MSASAFVTNISSAAMNTSTIQNVEFQVTAGYSSGIRRTLNAGQHPTCAIGRDLIITVLLKDRAVRGH